MILQGFVELYLVEFLNGLFLIHNQAPLWMSIPCFPADSLPDKQDVVEIF